MTQVHKASNVFFFLGAHDPNGMPLHLCCRQFGRCIREITPLAPGLGFAKKGRRLEMGDVPRAGTVQYSVYCILQHSISNLRLASLVHAFAALICKGFESWATVKLHYQGSPGPHRAWQISASLHPKPPLRIPAILQAP